MNLAGKALKYGSFAFIFFAPLVYWGHRLFPHISSKTFFIYGVVEILFFVWIYSVITDRSYRLPRKTLLWFLPLVGFVLWMTIAGIFAVDPGLALWSSLGRGTGLLTLYHSLTFSLVVASLARKDGLPYVLSFFQWVVAGAFVLAFSVWLGSEGLNLPASLLLGDGGGGLAGNSTLTAGYLLFAFALGVFLLFTKSINIKMKWLVGAAMALIIFSPLFLNIYGLFSGQGILGSARGTILSLFAGLGAALLAYICLSGNRKMKTAGVAMGIMGLIAFAFMWVQLVTPDTVVNQKFAEAARGTRFILWDVASQAMKERPVLGYGPENYFMAFQEKFDPQVFLAENSSEGWADRAHNIYYDLGVSAGYPAISLYAIFILSLFCGIYRSYKNDRLSRLQVSIIAGLVVAHVANHLFTFESNLSILILFALAGIIYALNQDDIKQKLLPVNIDRPVKHGIAYVLLALFVIASIFFVYMPSMKSKAYAETFATPVKDRFQKYPALLAGSKVGTHWDASGLGYNVYKWYAASPAEFKGDKKNLPYVVRDLEALIGYLYEVSKNNEIDHRLYITIALLENTLTYMSDRPYDEKTRDRVLGVLEKARSLAPANPNVYWTMAQTKVWGGDLEGAEGAYRQAIEVAPRLPASYDLALKYAQIVGNKKLFDEAMVQAKENIPGYELK